MIKKNIVLNLLTRGIILFWTLWFTLVLGSDLVDLLQTTELISDKILFSSHNHKLVFEFLSTYGLEAFSIMMYMAIILFIFILTVLFWYAYLSSNENITYLAFTLSLLFTAFFILCDELFIQYEFAHAHVVRLTFQITTFILFYLLCNREKRT